MSEKNKYVSPEYQLTLDNLAETLAADRRKRLAEAALQDTVEIPVITQGMLFEYDQENIPRGEE